MNSFMKAIKAFGYTVAGHTKNILPYNAKLYNAATVEQVQLKLAL